MTSSIPIGEYDRPDTPTTSQPSRRASRPTSTPPPHSQQHSIVSPPNKPRQSLSTQLAPDYSSWVNDVSTPATSTSTSTNKSNKQNKGRARRENQPSFTGSALTVSDLDEDPNHHDHDDQDIDNEGEPEPAYVGNDNDSGIGRRIRNPQQLEDSNTGTSYRDSSLSGQQSHPASSSSSSTGSKPAPRLRPLNKSRVESTDPSRPAYKLGPPLSTPSPPPPLQEATSPPNFGSSPSLRKASPPENFNETSALLGGTRPRNPQGRERWTNEGSSRRAPRYDGQDHLDEDQAMNGHDEDHDLDEGSDLLRRPSR